MVLSLRDSAMADDFEEDEIYALQVAIKELKATVELGASRIASRMDHIESVISSLLDGLEASILTMLPDDYKFAAFVGSTESLFPKPMNVVNHSLGTQLEKEIDQVNQEGPVFSTKDENQTRASLLLHHGSHSRGDVFCYETIKELNIKTKNWKELLTDEPFTKDDLITIQNPNALDSKVLLDFDPVKNNLKADDEEPNKMGSDPTYNINVSGDIKQMLQELGMTGELSYVVGNLSHFLNFRTLLAQRDYEFWPIRLAFVPGICKTTSCFTVFAEIHHLFPISIHHCISPALSNLVFDPGGVSTNENLNLVSTLHHFVTIIAVALEVVTMRFFANQIKLLSSLQHRLNAGEFYIPFLSLQLFQILHHCEHFAHLACIKLQPYRQRSMTLRKHHKLNLRYFGPFEVEQRIESVAYKLKLPEAAKIHPVFHVSLLKKCEGTTGSSYVPLPLLTEEEGPIIRPMAILESRQIQRQAQWVPQVLVQWDDGSTPTWETVTEFRKLYPTFDLEDKVSLEHGGDVMIQSEDGAQGNKAQANNEAIREMRRSARERRIPWKLRG